MLKKILYFIAPCVNIMSIVSATYTYIQDGWRRINFRTKPSPGNYTLYVSTGDTKAIKNKRWAIDHVKECGETGKRNIQKDLFYIQTNISITVAELRAISVTSHEILDCQSVNTSINVRFQGITNISSELSVKLRYQS